MCEKRHARAFTGKGADHEVGFFPAAGLDRMELARTMESQLAGPQLVLLAACRNQHLAFVDVDELPEIMRLAGKIEIARAPEIEQADQVGDRQDIFQGMAVIFHVRHRTPPPARRAKASILHYRPHVKKRLCNVADCAQTEALCLFRRARKMI